MARRTKKQILLSMIEGKLEELNTSLGRPTEPYTKHGDRFRANVGVYYLSGAYGGYNVFKIVNEGGGVTEPFGHGHLSKRECYKRLCDNIHLAD